MQEQGRGQKQQKGHNKWHKRRHVDVLWELCEHYSIPRWHPLFTAGHLSLAARGVIYEIWLCLLSSSNPGTRKAPLPSPAPRQAFSDRPCTDHNCSGGAARWEHAQESWGWGDPSGDVLLCFIISMCAEAAWSSQFWWLTFLCGKKPTDSSSAPVPTFLFFIAF